MADDTSALLILVVAHPDHACHTLLEWVYPQVGDRRISIQLHPPTVDGDLIRENLEADARLKILVYHRGTFDPPTVNSVILVPYNRSDDPDSISARIAGAAKEPRSEESFTDLARAVLRVARADGVEQAKDWLRWLDGSPAA